MAPPAIRWDKTLSVRLSSLTVVAIRLESLIYGVGGGNAWAGACISTPRWVSSPPRWSPFCSYMAAPRVYRRAFLLMVAATLIDATDGTLRSLGPHQGSAAELRWPPSR